MSTVGALVDRLYRDYLANPSDTPVQAKLQSAVTNSQTTIVYADELITEEQAMIGVGTIIEVDLEQMRVTDHAESTRTLTVTRGIYGTVAIEHGASSLMRVAPKWPRITAFDAICDEIVELYPEVYATQDEWADARELTVEVDEDAVGLVSVKQKIAGHFEDIPAELVRTDAASTGAIVQFSPRHQWVDESTVWIRFRKRFPLPTSEATTLASLGVDVTWERPIIIGAVASMLPQSDVDAATSEFITEQLENQGFRPTTATSLSVAMGRMRDQMLQRARRRQQATDGVRVHMHQVI